ncbi:MAG: DUF4998 domain-containing protein [Tannerella sp.]|jgi:hypothetical protein|nr:DUF4998 domain-containing protein [Tannerella sp.]
MKKISFLFTALMLFACHPMDDKYSEFANEGPITYIAKLNDADIQAIGERNRVHFIWPKQNDPRGSKVNIYWANKTGHYTQAVDPSKETNFYVSGLDEGSYIFEISILDDYGHFSIPVSVTVTVYGAIWESYLANRNFLTNTQDGDNRKLTYRTNTDKTAIGTQFEWKQDNQTYTAYVDSGSVEGFLENFKALSFRFRTQYIPEQGGVDVFNSPWMYFVENVSSASVDAGFDKPSNAFTLPVPNDGNWFGYEFRWTDKVTEQAHSQTVEGNEITLQNYNGLAVNIVTLYKFDDVKISTTPFEFSTVRYVDLDRSLWYIAPETRASDGSEILIGENNASFNTAALIVNKVKSPMISHWIPGGGNGSADANNVPSVLYDGNYDTFLSICKGPGPGATTTHTVGGVGPIPAGEQIYFILDLGEQKEFNYFRLVYRPGQGNQNLKPQMVSFYGSNGPDPLNATWTLIRGSIVPPGCTDPSNNSNLNHIGRISGNVVLPESNYRYVKMTYDGWTDSSNSMQLSELFLGLYY